MNKRRWSIILVIFFIVQSIAPATILPFEINPLNPPIRVNANSSDGSFQKLCGAICLGLFIYELDAVKGCAKDAIIKEYPGLLFNPEVRFDLANIDLGKKGWTSYYPFSVGDKDFIMRIFLTCEKAYQPAAPVLYEGSIANPAVTFQVLPSLSEILSDCKIKPARIYSSRQIDTSS